ncbi:hypothetical protein Sjap_018279 [Stephania japonica]|uniref:Uncharacterized protein n=1 Tax=Stephania japonica TaxID=461633 RepID=A0AAP0I7P3_9MAGN
MPRSSHGFDRKAQLLAYAHELRQQYRNSKNTNSWPMNNFPNNRPKTKWSWIRCPRVNYRPLLSRIFCRSRRQWQYRRIRSEDNINVNNHVKGTCKGSTKAQTQTDLGITIRIRCMVKKLACGWNCAKAGFETMD